MLLSWQGSVVTWGIHRGGIGLPSRSAQEVQQVVAFAAILADEVVTSPDGRSIDSLAGSRQCQDVVNSDRGGDSSAVQGHQERQAHVEHVQPWIMIVTHDSSAVQPSGMCSLFVPVRAFAAIIGRWICRYLGQSRCWWQ